MDVPETLRALEERQAEDPAHIPSMANLSEGLPLPGQLVFGDFRVAEAPVAAEDAQPTTDSRSESLVEVFCEFHVY
jgi:hypothetical protein